MFIQNKRAKRWLANLNTVEYHERFNQPRFKCNLTNSFRLQKLKAL